MANWANLQRGGVTTTSPRNSATPVETEEALTRPGRYRSVAGNLKVNGVRVGEDAREQRFVVYYNPQVARRDQRNKPEGN